MFSTTSTPRRGLATAALAVVLILLSNLSTRAAVIDLVILSGQSNALGIAPASGLPADPVDASIEYYYAIPDANSGGTFDTLQPLSWNATYGLSFGPEMGLARQLRNVHGLSNLAVVKTGQGGSNLFDTWATGGALFNHLVANIHLAVNVIEGRGDTVNLIGMAWMQGENDAFFSRTRTQYANDLNGFLDDLKANLDGLMPDIGFDAMNTAIGLVNEQAPSNIGLTEIQIAQMNVTHAREDAVLVDTTGFSQSIDGLHFDAAGQLALGNAFADELIKAYVPIPSTLALFLAVMAMRYWRTPLNALRTGLAGE